MIDKNQNHINDVMLKISNEYAKFLPEGVVKAIVEYVDYGEPALAFQELCNYLYEYDVIISKETFFTIQQIGDKFELDEGDWIFLQKLLPKD